MSQDFIYPFDPTGNASSNLIEGERQPISPPNWTDFYFVIPKFAPFYKDSLRVIHRPSGKILEEGIDYHCTHRFRDASLMLANRVYGSITLLDKTLAGLVDMDYQTIGGPWVIDEDERLSVLSNTLLNPRITTWEEVVGLPYAFPPIDHEWDLENLKGMDDVVSIIEEIAEVIRESAGSEFTNHINDLNNPHGTTKFHIQLGNVQNFGIATLIEAQEGNVNNKYMTPLRTRQLVSSIFVPLLDNHINDNTNPHGTTKAQVQLGNVENFGIATEQEAQEGNVNNKYMTPALVKIAIENLAGSDFNAHINDNTNPHGTTKAQVQLGNVENFGIATRLEAEAGDVNDKYMTPLRTKQAINVIVGETLLNHINSTGNVHNLTANDINTYEKEHIDFVLSRKLDFDGTAQDSLTVGGYSVDDIFERVDQTSGSFSRRNFYLSFIDGDITDVLNVWEKIATIRIDREEHYLDGEVTITLNGFGSIDGSKNNNVTLNIPLNNDEKNALILKGEVDRNQFYWRDIEEVNEFYDENDPGSLENVIIREIWMKTVNPRTTLYGNIISNYEITTPGENDSYLSNEPSNLEMFSINFILNDVEISNVIDGFTTAFNEASLLLN